MYKQIIYIFMILSHFINIYIFFIFLLIINVAMVNKNILRIRNKLDKLDIAFLKLIKKRTFLVNQVLKNKKYKKEIIDRKRIKIILKNIKNKSKKNKIDPKITTRIWKSMIKAFIDYEYRNFKKKIKIIYYEVVISFLKKIRVFLYLDYIFLI